MSSDPVPAAVRPLRLCVGGTRPQDVTALTDLLAALLEQRGLTGAARGRQGAALPLSERPLLVPVGPHEDQVQAEADLKARTGQSPAETDLVLRTSGSSAGSGSLVAMSAAALVASARATHERLGGPGTWVLALPAHHVAGLQVLVRAVVAGRPAVVVDTTDGFRTSALAQGLRRAHEQAAGEAVYVSLVPTQLLRVLEDPAATEALALADTVLLGGGAADPRLLERARAAGLRAVTTYGMSETGGGCVYDGVPLGPVSARVEDPDAQGVGRVVLAGPVLAEGYLSGGSPTSLRPASQDGTGWVTAEAGSQDATGYQPVRELVTADRGVLETGSDGVTRLRVLGRVDDLIISGGVKVDPRVVEEVLTSLPGVDQACVVGVSDPQWGQAVVAAVVPSRGASLDPVRLRGQARLRLTGVQAPKHVTVLDQLPQRGPGKVDRRAVTVLLTPGVR